MSDVSFREWFYLVAAEANMEENYLAKACFWIDYSQAPFTKRCPITAHQKRVSVTSKKTHKTNQFLPTTGHYAPFRAPNQQAPKGRARTPGLIIPQKALT
ncbi:hypothetical protein CEXT_365191 [Caerostris extrusa]|uniref:Uncharacterized protein n=1 Tax=Caerostris extrusa TaxID=172846 RepID=A0AAV4VBV2_CAEEX|nr:hypothetical protein CEXT_365191 [Caerostris extrusa]